MLSFEAKFKKIMGGIWKLGSHFQNHWKDSLLGFFFFSPLGLVWFFCFVVVFMVCFILFCLLRGVKHGIWTYTLHFADKCTLKRLIMLHSYWFWREIFRSIKPANNLCDFGKDGFSHIMRVPGFTSESALQRAQLSRV